MRAARKTAELPADEVHRWAYENPRPELVALVPAAAGRVLDLGCSSGALGAAVKARQTVEVVGVELEPAYAERARGRLDEVLVGDLEVLASEGGLDGLGEFDCLIAGDVLEHLRDPWTVVRTAAARLRPEGVAIVSLPNVRHWEVLWSIAVRGTFPRHEQGILDRTHLRWFTAADGVELLAGAGLEVAAHERVYALRTVSGPRDRVARLTARLPLRPFFVLQNIFVGRRPAPTAQARASAS